MSLKAAFAVAGRIEYFQADTLPFFMGLFLAVPFHELFANWALVVEGLAVIIFIHYATVWLNCLADYDMDKKYKSSLPDAVDAAGHRFLSMVSVLFMVMGSLLMVHLSIILSKPYLFALWVLGSFIGQAYSLRPLRLKRFPIVGDLSRGFALICLVLFGYILLADKISSLFIAFLVGHNLVLLGSFGVAEIWDYSDDIEEGIKTIATQWGFKWSLIWALTLVSLGSVFIIFPLGCEILVKNVMFFVLYFPLFLLAYILPIYEIYGIYQKRDQDYLTVLKPIGKRHQLWLVLWYVSALIACLLVSIL